MSKSTNWKRLEFFTLITVTALISSGIWQKMEAAEVPTSEKSIPERLEKVRQQVQFLQTLSENSDLQGESAISPEADQDRDHLSQWTNWPNWADQWSNWSNWPNWSDWPNWSNH